MAKAMSSKDSCCSSGSCCESKCWMWKGVVILVVGLLYLLDDYGYGFMWWQVSWYTALFVLMGLCFLWKGLKK